MAERQSQTVFVMQQQQQQQQQQAVGGRPPQYAPPPVTLTFDLLTLKVVSESHVTWATSVPISVLLGLSVLDLCSMYATDRHQARIIA